MSMVRLPIFFVKVTVALLLDFGGEEAESSKAFTGEMGFNDKFKDGGRDGV